MYVAADFYQISALKEAARSNLHDLMCYGDEAAVQDILMSAYVIYNEAPAACSDLKAMLISCINRNKKTLFGQCGFASGRKVLEDIPQLSVDVLCTLAERIGTRYTYTDQSYETPLHCSRCGQLCILVSEIKDAVNMSDFHRHCFCS